MADNKIINNVTVTINGETIATVKCEGLKGHPKYKVETARIGNKTKAFYSVDATEAMGKVTITIKHTKENVYALDTWFLVSAKNGNEITISNDNGYELAYKEMRVEGEPTFSTESADLDVTFIGQPIV